MLNYIIELFYSFCLHGELHVAMVINAIFFFNGLILHYAYGNVKYELHGDFSLPYDCVMNFLIWCKSYYDTIA